MQEAQQALGLSRAELTERLRRGDLIAFRAHVGEHWEILLWSLMLFRYVYPGNSDYVPANIWQDLIGRLAKATSNPDPQQAFRGSLIDDCMFAIDVKEWGLEDILSRYRAERAHPISMPTEQVEVGSAEAE